MTSFCLLSTKLLMIFKVNIEQLVSETRCSMRREFCYAPHIDIKETINVTRSGESRQKSQMMKQQKLA